MVDVAILTPPQKENYENNNAHGFRHIFCVVRAADGQQAGGKTNIDWRHVRPRCGCIV